ncbi:MAG TPA: methylated-DNA--[protein]-cysteine S-methyltransferase [Rhodocyclaceae bacterium]|nr:methylated-DNA--[protein]-cysteine S-methyltransferase [Rhodocyclaceae bacterium]HNH34710.1 methylated-DNA--[protein]-cysteine S-methyltransferase [Rhodocyclaceae bacterium]
MNEVLVWTETPTPLGPMIVAAEGEGLSGAWFPGQRHFAGVGARWRRDDREPLLRTAADQLDAYFAGRLTRFDLPLAPRGTVFQRAVWRAIAEVGYGATCRYGEVAAALGRPSASRAVGAATGRNPLGIIVPCHRLVGIGGALTGYAGGIARKRALLAMEASRRP